MRVWMMVFGMVIAAPLQAQEAPVARQDVAGLMQSLPEKALKKLRGAPEAFLEDAAGLIYGFGTKGGIDLAGIDAFVAAERARIRAAAMERYLAADLDNDGEVTRDEVAVLANAAAAGKRGRLRLGHDLADADKNGVLSLIELRNYAQGEAMKDMSVDDADGLRSFLMFDLDGDGVAAMEEVAAGVSAMLDDA